MRFGIYCPNFGAFGDARTVAEFAQEAEQCGWDGLFLWDHVARSFETPVVDPWVALSAAAMMTARIKLGALVTPMPRRRPWKLARETVSLDHLSDGRLVLGVGIGSAGGSDVEWSSFDEELDLKTRAAMLDEGLEVLTGLWSGEAFQHQGEHYQVTEAHFLPPPLQRPRIPIWVAGYWPNKKPFKRAARWDGVFPLFRAGGDPGSDLDALRDCVKFVRDARGNDDFDVIHLAAPTPGNEPERAREIVVPYAEAGATWWLERFTPDEFGGGWKGKWPFEKMLERVAQGPPPVQGVPSLR